MAKEKKEKHFIHKPIYEGGNNALKRFIGQNQRYPKAAKEAGIEGTVVLRYGINHKGKVTETKIISGIGHGCDEEAIRLVKLLQFKVAKNRGVKATFHKTIKIHFRKPTIKEQQVATTYNYAVTTSNNSNTKKINNSPTKKKTSYNYTINLGTSTDPNTSE